MIRKNIVITGASTGIGLETARSCASNSPCTIIAIYRSDDKLQNIKNIIPTLPSNSSIIPFKFDITTHSQQSLFDFIQKTMQNVDILINNAGTLTLKPFTELTRIDFTKQWETNFLGTALTIQTLIPLLNQNSHIVNIGSMGGIQGSSKFSGLAGYSSSKGAIHILTECLAQELEERKIKINCLALGAVQTEMLSLAFPNYKAPITATEMGKFIADFSINGHQYFNGKILPVATSTP